MPTSERSTPAAQTMGRDSRFRDPPPPEEEARALQLRLATILVGAPALPVDIPGTGLRLLAVDGDGASIALHLGVEDPLATLRLAPSDTMSLRPAPGATAPPRLTATVTEARPEGARFRPALEAIAARLAQVVDGDRWQRARAVVDTLRRLPAAVPLGFYRQLVQGLELPTGQVRTGFGCNQDCGLCWQGRKWGSYGSEQLRRWIEDLRGAGAQSLIISGGEPTLDAGLCSYVALARELGFTSVILETNAVLLGKPGRAEALRAAGLTDAFVSLHSADAATSDAITRAPGTHARTLAGVEALLAAGVPVRINTVLTREGLAHLPAMPALLAQRLGHFGALLRGWMLSYPTAAFDRDQNAAIVPPPAALREALRKTLPLAFAAGIVPRGLDGPCGPPLCAFDADDRVTSGAPTPGAVEFRLHVAACASCAVRPACFGVRALDVELFGEDCVFPLTSRPG